MTMNHYILKNAGLLSLLLLLMVGCKKDDESFDNPYAGGKQPLGIKVSTDLPSPEEGTAGTVVTFKATGLLPYKDSMVFYLNSEPADIVKMDSTTITIKVPKSASTGIASIVVGDQIFFGPIFKVDGKLSIDPNFKAVVGANNSVNDYLRLDDGRLILVGSFSDFNHKGAVKPLNRIVMTSKDGEVDRSFNSGVAADGYLSAITSFPNGELIIGGSFSSYDTHRGEIHNITTLNKDGSPDTMVVRTFLELDTVPSFNGGTDGRINRLFIQDGMVLAVGDFNYYLSYRYGESDYLHERDSLITDSVMVRNLIRFFPDGSLDSSFNYNFFEHRSYTGTNGPISDAYMQDDGKVILVGRFTQYNGEAVNNIVRINKNGDIDRSFHVGNGADDPISSIRYNETTQRFMLAGNFEHFNGLPYSGLVMLKKDGSTDASFKPSEKATNASYRYAQQLSNGLIIVGGYFKTYEGVHRGNFMVLNATGELAPGYNNTGNFYGTVYRGFESTNSLGQNLVTLIGGFYKFNEKTMGSITRLVVE